MSAPVSPLYIDIPGKGTARVYFELFGDQSDAQISNVYEQLDWKPAGSPVFEMIDESAHVGLLGGVIDSIPVYLENALRASGVAGFPPVDQSGVPGGGRALVEWFLAKPKPEVDAMLAKWAREKLYPAIAKWANRILAPHLAGVSTPAGVYSNVGEALNGVWANVRVSIVDGEIRLSA